MSPKLKTSLCVIVVMCVCVCLWVMYFIAQMSAGDIDRLNEKLNAPLPLEPTVKSAEIDFCLQYTVNGESREVSDTLICEYDGYYYSYNEHKNVREWKKHYRSDDTAKHLILYQWIETYGIETYAIIIDLFPASYFMSDPDCDQDDQQVQYPFSLKVYDVLNKYYVEEEREARLLDICGFKILGWTCDPPVVNEFK